MSIEADLRVFLLADAGVSALVAARIYPAPAPQDAVMPFVTYQRITGQRVNSLTGPSGVAQPTYQIDAWSDNIEQGGSYGPALALGTAVRHALDGYRGSWSGKRVAAILLDDRDLSEDLTRTRRVSMDFRIWHEEA